MRTIIAGSRSIYLEPELLQKFIDSSGIKITEVVCGCARGVDLSGSDWGSQKGVKVVDFPADWGKHGKSAGPIRNGEMADYADALILIWDGKSRGSANMLQQAMRKNLKVVKYVV